MSLFALSGEGITFIFSFLPWQQATGFSTLEGEQSQVLLVVGAVILVPYARFLSKSLRLSPVSGQKHSELHSSSSRTTTFRPLL